jgi:pantoate--beta-alanine ligase
MNQMKSLTIVRTVTDLRAAVAKYRAAGCSTGLIPTMGALHAGHGSLVQGALDRGDVAIASIFVNPTQFGPKEDFAAYPRGEAEDFAKLEAAGCRVVFAPAVAEMYPRPQLAVVTVGGSLTDGLCGPFRPGHFQGVATVVCKLLLMAMPDRGYFGEKDYQQLQVLKRMARDLNLPVEILGLPTLREADGLAMSSRNRYLAPEERTIAVALHRELVEAAAKVRDRKTSCGEVAAVATRSLLAAGFRAVDYFTVVDADTLAPLEHVTGPARIAAAAHLGRTRLIDNVPV